MPSHNEATPTIEVEDLELPNEGSDNPDSVEELSTAADEAEAEAAEAESLAAAARARAHAIRLRRAAVDADRQAPSEPVSAPAAESPQVGEIEPDAGPADVRAEDTADDVAVCDAAEVDAVADCAVAAVAQPHRSTARLVVGVMALTLVVALSLGLIGFGGWTMWRHHKVAAEQHARAEFAAGAQQGCVNLMSLDYQHAKEDVQRIIDGAAGGFKKDFQATAEDFIKVAQSSKSVTTTTVTATAVSAMTQDTATVLVAATTKVSNVAGKDQPPRAWRLNVDVVRDGGQIKLAKVEFVP